MLQTLAIRDVVLIEHLDLEFHGRLGVLTGETGAGKSILLDALGLALGARADSGLVRQGAERASVTATFGVADGHPALALLRDNDLSAEPGEPLILRRVLGADGRSRAYINDQSVSVGLLRAAGETLVDVHGQFENQRLMDTATHRRLLDGHAGLESRRRSVGQAYQAWQAAVQERTAAEADGEQARRDEDFLRHAVAELESADPQPGEEADLAADRDLLMNGEKLLEALNQAAAEFGAGKGVDGALAAASAHLTRVTGPGGETIREAVAALDRAAVEAVEAQARLEAAAAAIDLDPSRLETVEERLFNLRALARKHGVDVDGLSAIRDTLAGRLAAIDGGEAHLGALRQQEQAARQAYADAADALSAARHKGAGRLDKAVAGELEPLRLGGARFCTAVEDLPEADWGATGRDRVTFRVATNPGQDPGPLTRISSGGELARFMLALKVVLARADPVPTIVFDEVDSGVGGAVAAAVGERLAGLAEDFQVLVVTHSPQVAARGAHHWRVSKAAARPGTQTTVDVLDDADRREEIARMLAGARITDEARAAAASLLESPGGKA